MKLYVCTHPRLIAQGIWAHTAAEARVTFRDIYGYAPKTVRRYRVDRAY